MFLSKKNLIQENDTCKLFNVKRRSSNDSSRTVSCHLCQFSYKVLCLGLSGPDTFRAGTYGGFQTSCFSPSALRLNWILTRNKLSQFKDRHNGNALQKQTELRDPVSSITNCYRLIVSYTDPVHSFIIS